LSLAQMHGQQKGNRVTLRISQEELANFLGVSRQVVNQYLQGWKGRGWVDIGRGSVTVLDQAALKGATQKS
jgi:CRP/FNR family transcriptional regulator, cyclic AMP receptor protein